MKTNMYFWLYLTQFFLELEMFQNIGEIQNTHFRFKIVFRKSCPLWDNMEKYCRARQATDDNMAHAHCMLDI